MACPSTRVFHLHTQGYSSAGRRTPWAPPRAETPAPDWPTLRTTKQFARTCVEESLRRDAGIAAADHHDFGAGALGQFTLAATARSGGCDVKIR